jgi:hypothetical protein
MARIPKGFLLILFPLLLKAQTGAESDSLTFGTITFKVESLSVGTRPVGSDSLERKAAVTLSFTERSDSTGQKIRLEFYTKEKIDTIRMALRNATSPLPVKKRSWRRWGEPVIVFSTLSSMVYLFYSVRSQ